LEKNYKKHEDLQYISQKEIEEISRYYDGITKI